MTERAVRLVELMDKATQGESNADRALYCLLKRYQDVLPELDDYFHKAFRQTDVTDSGYTDSAIWHLIGESQVFWRCFEKCQGEKEVSNE